MTGKGTSSLVPIKSCHSEWGFSPVWNPLSARSTSPQLLSEKGATSRLSVGLAERDLRPCWDKDERIRIAEQGYPPLLSDGPMRHDK